MLILHFLGLWIFYLGKFQPSETTKNHKNQIRASKCVENGSLFISKIPEIDFSVNLMIRKILKCPHCENALVKEAFFKRMYFWECAYLNPFFKATKILFTIIAMLFVSSIFTVAGNFLHGVYLVARNCDFSPHQENVTSSEGAISFYHQKLTPNWTIHLTFLVEKLPNILRCITKIEIFLSLLNYFGIILMQNTFFPRFFFFEKKNERLIIYFQSNAFYKFMQIFAETSVKKVLNDIVIPPFLKNE